MTNDNVIAFPQPAPIIVPDNLIDQVSTENEEPQGQQFDLSNPIQFSMALRSLLNFYTSIIEFADDVKNGKKEEQFNEEELSNLFNEFGQQWIQVLNPAVMANYLTYVEMLEAEILTRLSLEQLTPKLALIMDEHKNYDIHSSILKKSSIIQ